MWNIIAFALLLGYEFFFGKKNSRHDAEGDIWLLLDLDDDFD